MSELWQFGGLILIAVIAAALWFFVIYKPRHTVEGEEELDLVDNPSEDEEKS